MSFLERLSLGFSTAFIGMGIVFIVLIVLCLVIILESKIIGALSLRFKKPEIPGQPYKPAVKAIVERKGVTSGQMVVSGVEDDETLALIMTVISNHTEIPLNKLVFKSIKAL